MIGNQFRTDCMAQGIGIASEFPLYPRSESYAAKAEKLFAAKPAKPFASLRKIGGIWHFRLGRIVGSLCIAKGGRG